MIEVTYYVLLNKVRIDLTKVAPGFCDLAFQVTRNTSENEEPQKLVDDKVQLNKKVIRISEVNEKFADIVFPDAGIVLKNSDQFLLFEHRIFLVSDDEIKMQVQANGALAQANFTVPRPPKPYPSWSWFQGRWNAPITMPNDGDYQWDESNLRWVAV
jgi:hypothetical protein